MKSEIRMQMLESTLKREISLALIRLDVMTGSITRITISKDLRYASVYCVDSGGSHTNPEMDQEVADRLSSLIHKISPIVIERWSGYRFPKLRFLPDKQMRYEERVLEKIDQQIQKTEDVLRHSGEEMNESQDEEAQDMEHNNQDEVINNQE